MLLNTKILLISFVLFLSGCGGGGTTSNNPNQNSGGSTPSKVIPLFSWSPVMGATQYELGFEKENGTGWQSIIKSAAAFSCQSGSCFYTPKKLFVGIKLKWFVKAYVAGKWQAWSAEKIVTVKKINISSGTGGTNTSHDKQAPTAPKNLQKNKVKADLVSIKWDASTDNVKVTAYNVYRNGNYLSYAEETSYEDKTVKPNTSYKYQVRAIDAAANESTASNSLSVKTEQSGLTNIQEPNGIYNTDQGVLQVAVKILSGSGVCKVDQYDGCTFGQVLNDINWKDDFKPEVKAEFTTEGGFYAAATFRQRGGYTRFNPMKSFRVKLEKGSNGKKVYWQGERKIQLLKSFDDLTRVKHKLSYDLFSEIDHLPSMRSRFVRLKVKDKGSFNFTKNPTYSPHSSYKETDMGLYLQVEYFGKEYLERRKWKKGSGIYKANNFLFNWGSDTQVALSVDSKGKPKDEKAFEKLLEIKSGKDHRELINFMDAIHDYSNNFNTDVLGKYLDRDNYITWLAVNILTANNDTVAHNYYLYNPKGTSKFYFVPWDYDFAYNGPDIAYTTTGERISMPAKPPYWFTHASRWGNDLHGRFLEDSGNLAALKQKVAALKQSTFTKSNIKAKLASYESAIAYNVTGDVDDLWGIYSQSSESERVRAYHKALDELANNVETNYRNFLKYFNSPMQFYMDAATVTGGEFYMTWGNSVSLQGNSVSYDVIISTSPKFNAADIIEKITGVTGHKQRMTWSHSSGRYYIKVIARDSQGNWQSAGNDYDVTDSSGTLLYKIYGIDTFDVN